MSGVTCMRLNRQQQLPLASRKVLNPVLQTVGLALDVRPLTGTAMG
jgi:hypothetical protein